MARIRVRESVDEIADILRDKIEDSERVDEANKELAEDARDHWKSISPVRTGAYRDATHVEKRPDHNDLPARRVVNDDEKAEYIEFGTGGETPTEAFAPMAETAVRFGGDPT